MHMTLPDTHPNQLRNMLIRIFCCFTYTVIAGGSTYIVISRPDGSTVSEIVQKADESAVGIKE